MATSDTILQALRGRVVGEEFDHQAVIDAAKDYARPRDLITRLSRSGAIVPVAPGIYVFGPLYRRRPYSLEVLANLIAGPSYVSLDYALQHYGLIPERVAAVTSGIAGRPRRFETPVGLFIYRQVPARAFAQGLSRLEIAGGGGFLIASPEKALADKVRDDRGLGIRSTDQMITYLVESLRLDVDALAVLDSGEIERIAVIYSSHKLKLLSAAIRSLQREHSDE